MRQGLFILVAVVVLGLTGCDVGRQGPVASPDETGVLVVATRNGPTNWYHDRNGKPAGPEHDLVEAFAASRGWTVDWRVLPATAEVLEALDQRRVHLAAAGLTHLPERDEAHEPGLVYGEVVEQVVCHREDRPLPSTPAELPEVRLQVTADSSYALTLARLAGEHPGIRFAEDSARTTQALLVQVAEREIQCTVADSNIVRTVRRHWPHLEVAMDLGTSRPVGWYVAAGRETLARWTREWRDSEVGKGAVEAVYDRYYAYLGDFDFVDMRALKRRIDARLPRYRPMFEQAAAETGLPADLLAAMAYQESHWDPQAESPTGVRGMMMLTRNTAESLDVEDRLDPVESILGGARYLADRHERLPEEIPEPDRTYLALASYNIGRAHVLDARRLARELGKDPDSWADMREVLPLKADKRYYPQTKYGYARGYEPVHYVQRIRNYRDVIARAME